MKISQLKNKKQRRFISLLFDTFIKSVGTSGDTPLILPENMIKL